MDFLVMQNFRSLGFCLRMKGHLKLPNILCSAVLKGHMDPLHRKFSKECSGGGKVKLHNPNIKNMKEDFLYHLGFGTKTHDLPKMFGDVKFVCMGGTATRMKSFAHLMMKEIGYKIPVGTQLHDMCAAAHRYSLYKVGPIICVNHGMGNPSISILLHELIKLMHYAKCKNPIFIRLGTCGGVGVEGGTVCITEDAYNPKLKNCHEFTILGKTVSRPAKFDRELACELKSLVSKDDKFETVIGNTLCTDDFYEGQGRRDGAFCKFSEEEKLKFLESLTCKGIVNIEMESSMLAALTGYAGIKAACVCVAILNRLKGDQVVATKEDFVEWQRRESLLISRYIRKSLAIC